MKTIFLPLLFMTINAMAQQVVPEYWYHKPMRILQTVLRQPDASGYNVDSLVAYMKTTHANTLVINGGGIVDYFQNELPMANLNPYIGQRDLLKEIVEGCHKANIKVIARVDFRGVHKERYDQHPDWFAKDEHGNPIILNYTTPGLYAPCYNSYYRNGHAVQFIDQLMDKYHVDGIWHNSVNFHNVCYCGTCKSDYRQKNSKDIPVKQSAPEDWEVYYQWNAGVAERQLKLMRSTVKKYGDDKSYAAEVFDMYKIEQQKHTGISLYSAAEYFDFFVIVAFLADNTAKVEYKDIYYPAAIIKFLKSLEPHKAPVILFGGNGTEHRYIYDPPLDSRLWLWEAAAVGGGFWNCYFNGAYPAVAPDARNAYLAIDAYKYLLDNEQFIQTLQPVTDIGIMYSKPSGEFVGDVTFSASMRGVQRLMAENHLQYGFVSDKMISSDYLKRFKILFLPNIAVLSDEHEQLIKDWVHQGGKLISTFQTSLYDAQGSARNDFGLAEVFGVRYLHEKVNTEMDCYQKIITRNELLRGMEKTALLHNGGYTLMTKALNGAEVITGYLPKINNQPPENAFPANWDSEYPIMVLNNFGKGASIYFANEIEKLNYSIGHPDYDQLLINSIRYLLGAEKVLETNAPASVHIYLNQSLADQKTYQISIVNTSSSSHRPFRSLIPVGDIIVDLPFKISSVELLTDGTDPGIELGRNTLKISRMEEFISLKIFAE